MWHDIYIYMYIIKTTTESSSQKHSMTFFSDITSVPLTMQPSNGRTSWITCSCPWCPIRCEAALLIENESLCLQFFTQRSGGASLTRDPPRISPETRLPLELPRWVCQHGALPRWAAGNTTTHVPPTQPLKKKNICLYLSEIYPVPCPQWAAVPDGQWSRAKQCGNCQHRCPDTHCEGR